MIEIDGSHGEGGGQILRSALALSMLTGRPFRISNIRGRRPKPGLLRQHLTGVQAACAICAAKTSRPALGSTELTFEPGPVRGGHYQFAVGTAGSTVLVLQTILPALLLTRERSSIVVEGGTHAKAAPPFEFFDQCFLPVINRMGPRVRAQLIRHGFYPAGGGRIEIQTAPAAGLTWTNLTDRGPLLETRSHVLMAGIAGRVARDENDSARKKLGWPDDCFTIETLAETCGPGNVQLLTARFEHATEIVTGFGEPGVTASRIGQNAAKRMQGFLASDAAVGPHLADQLLLPIAMAGGGSFTTVRPTEHCRTNAQVVALFTGLSVRFERADRGEFVCSVG